MNTLELINAGKYKRADARFVAVDGARLRRRNRILAWAKTYSDTALDQQHDPEHADDLPNYRDSLEMDLCDALREHVPNLTAREYETALMAFRKALPAKFND